MTFTASAASAQPVSRRERREIERRAAESAELLQAAEPVFVSRRERRMAEVAALAAAAPAAVERAVSKQADVASLAPVQQPAVEVPAVAPEPVTRASLRRAAALAASAEQAVAAKPVAVKPAAAVAKPAAARVKPAAAEQPAATQLPAAASSAPRVGLEAFMAAATAPIPKQAISFPAAELGITQPLEFTTPVHLGSRRAARTAAARRPKRTGRIAGAFAVGVAASAGLAVWLPSTTDSANASVDALAEGEPGQVLAVAASAGQEAPVVLRTDAVHVSTMGSATAANLLTPMAINDAKAFTNDLTAPVQYPFPTGVPVTDAYGMRVHPVTGQTKMHAGVDLTPGTGTPVGAMADGRVIQVQSSDAGGYGVFVVVEHMIDGQRVTTLYGHLLSEATPLVKVGDTVRVGDIVGRVGNTGTSTGAHLHFEVRVGTDTNTVDPMAYLATHNNPATVVNPVDASVRA